jgi:hypothetical protein
MKHKVLSEIGVALVATLISVPAFGQQPVAPQPQPQAESQPRTEADSRSAPAREIVPLDIEVVVSRYQDDKRVSSAPYSLAVNANEGGASLRMGADVPVPTMMGPRQASGASEAMPGPVTYRTIGTNIDSRATTIDNSRFQVSITVSDTSVYTNVGEGTVPSAGGMPVFRSFSSQNTVLLRDGQTRQFTAAVDRVNGEVVRIEVTLRVVK